MPPKHAPLRPVLIVEDDALMRVVYKRLFQDHAPELAFHLEARAEDALKYRRENGADAAILDWDLPGISGLDLLKTLRDDSVGRYVRIIVVSGRTGVEDQILALESGADELLSVA